MADGVESVTTAFGRSKEGGSGEHLSLLLERLAETPLERTTVGDIAIALQDRSFGAFLLIFALPDLVLGLPLAVVALLLAGFVVLTAGAILALVF